MLSSIQESYLIQIQEQGRITANMDIRYIASLDFTDTVEGVLFWAILYYSYSIYGVHDYETLIRIYIRFDSVPNKDIDIFDIYRDYFDEVNGTLTSEGFRHLIENI